MRKLLLTLCAFVFALGASAQENEGGTFLKAFSFTVEPDGETPAVITSLTTDATSELKFRIDWGDGVLSEEYTLEDYTTTWYPTAYSAVPKGNTITVYAENPASVHYIDGSWKKETLKWTSIDMSNLTGLKSLELASNAITAIDVTNNTALESLGLGNNDVVGALDLSANVNLKYVDFSNSETIGTNNIDGTDFTVLPNATTIKVALNQLTDIKVAGLSKLTTLNINSCGLNTIDLSGCTSLKTLNSNDNNFETIDISECATVKAYFYLNNNKLKSIKTAEAYTSARLQVKDNLFTFATLPAVGLFQTYAYSPQADIEIAAEGSTVDLTAFMPVVGENATVAAWVNGEETLVENEDYTAAGGVFTFLKNFDKVAVQLTNDAFPGLTLNSNAVSVVATGVDTIKAADKTAVFYNLQGVRVVQPKAGNVYIRVSDGVTTKVVR